MNSVIILFVCTLLALTNAQGPPPVLSDTFMSNCTIFLKIEQYPVPCWITQDNVNGLFAFSAVLPKGHFVLPNGYHFKVFLTPSKFYTVYQNPIGDPECYCLLGTYIRYWWWVSDATQDPYPPAGTDLTCWSLNNLVEEKICFDPSNLTTPKREYKEFEALSMEFVQYYSYVSGVANKTMLVLPEECANTECP